MQQMMIEKESMLIKREQENQELKKELAVKKNLCLVCEV